jgi:hypothetical protein
MICILEKLSSIFFGDAGKWSQIVLASKGKKFITFLLYLLLLYNICILLVIHYIEKSQNTHLDTTSNDTKVKFKGLNYYKHEI